MEDVSSQHTVALSKPLALWPKSGHMGKGHGGPGRASQPRWVGRHMVGDLGSWILECLLPWHRRLVRARRAVGPGARVAAGRMNGLSVVRELCSEPLCAALSGRWKCGQRDLLAGGCPAVPPQPALGVPPRQPSAGVWTLLQEDEAGPELPGHAPRSLSLDSRQSLLCRIELMQPPPPPK